MTNSDSSNPTVGDHANHEIFDFKNTITSKAPKPDEDPLGYTQNFERLVRFARKFSLTKEEAEDIAGTAFCNVFEYLEKRNWDVEIRNPYSLLANTAFHLVIDKKRKEKRVRLIPLEITNDDDENYVNEPSDNSSGADHIHREFDDEEFFHKAIQIHLAGFSDYETQLLWLIFVEDCKPRDVARLLSINDEKAQADCNRVKAKLRARTKKKVESDKRKIDDRDNYKQI